MKTFTGLFLIVYGIERVMETFGRRPKLRGKIIARYSLPLILITYVSFYLTLLWDWFTTEQVSVLSVAVGTTFVIASIIGRNWSIKTLGIYHSIHIEIRDHHSLIQSGPYRFVRNPYYLSNIVEAVGLLLIVNSSRAWIIAALVYLPVLIHRLAIEQLALENKFKANFAKYRAQVPLLIPKCFCRGRYVGSV